MVNFDYLYNPEAAKSHFSKNCFVDKKLGFQVIENGTILPHKGDGGLKNLGGIVDDKENFVADTSATHYTGGIYTPLESSQHSSKIVVYLGMFYNIWGHIITDNIRRLWFLESDEFKSLFRSCPIVFIPWSFKREVAEKNFFRLLEILGIDTNKLQPITQPTQFKRIILPDSSFTISSFTKEYRDTINRVREFAQKNKTPTSYEKVYYFHGKSQYGERRLAEYFKSKGYEIISPEKLTVDEQLNVLANCKSFASTIGSCSHNSVFLQDNTEVVLIVRAAKNFTNYQLALDQVHLSNVSYIDSTLSLFKLSNHNFCYIISQQLKRFFGDKWNGYDEEDFKIFLQYVKNSLSKGFVVNQEVKRLYGKVLEDFMARLKQREDLIKAYDMPHGWETFEPQIPDGLIYQTHVGMKGWRDGWKSENQISNPLEPFNEKFYIQAIKIKFSEQKVYYSVYYNEEEGWSEEVSNGEQAGTTGKSKPIYGMRVRLDEADAKEFDILYRMHKFDDTWTPWAKNGEALYSHGQKLNAIQIKLEPVKFVEADIKKFDYTQAALMKSDALHLKGQRQSIM